MHALAVVVLVVSCTIPRLASAEPTTLLIAEEPAADEPDAPDTSTGPPPDALFPGAWRVGLSLAHGVPFSAVGEVSLGTGDDFALGFVAGLATTGDESAIGGRARIRVIDAGVVDVALVLPVLYYPPVEKRDFASWLLTSPAVLLRGRPSDDWLVYGGAGAVLAACADDIAAVFSGEAMHHEAASEDMISGAWHTFNGGASLRVYDDLAMFLDTMVMMTRFEPSESYSEQVGPPFLAELGANYTF